MPTRIRVTIHLAEIENAPVDLDDVFNCERLVKNTELSCFPPIGADVAVGEIFGKVSEIWCDAARNTIDVGVKVDGQEFTPMLIAYLKDPANGWAKET